MHIGDEILPSYIGIIISHYNKDPKKPTSISWKVRPGFFRGSCGSDIGFHGKKRRLLKKGLTNILPNGRLNVQVNL